MKADHALIAGSSFHMELPASFRNAVEMTPTAFCKPAGRSALAIDADALFSRITGCQSSSDALRMARPATDGEPLNTRISAPLSFRISIWPSTELSETSKAMSATISPAVSPRPSRKPWNSTRPN